MAGWRLQSGNVEFLSFFGRPQNGSDNYDSSAYTTDGKMCAFLCVHARARVCVCEREREKERERDESEVSHE